jgi:hypothetical protein
LWVEGAQVQELKPPFTTPPDFVRDVVTERVFGGRVSHSGAIFLSRAPI